MKKIALAVLAILMAATMAACGSEKKSADFVTSAGPVSSAFASSSGDSVQ